MLKVSSSPFPELCPSSSLPPVPRSVGVADTSKTINNSLQEYSPFLGTGSNRLI